jgi:hypothetical protein
MSVSPMSTAAHAALLALTLGAGATAEEARVTLESGEIVAAPAGPGAELHVFVDGPAGIPPLLGETRSEAGRLVFAPRYPFADGMGFRVVFRPGADSPEVVRRIATPSRERTPTARVRAIYPSVDRIPENQLKLYVVFSEPMQLGEAYQRIRLLDEDGSRVELPFLEVEPELWDPTWTRLTLFFDPGRIKRGLRPNEEEGPPLRAGSRYTLVVDEAWPDASGDPLAKGATRRLEVGPADHDPPSTESWQVEVPSAGTLTPAVVRFPEPLDRGLLERCLELTDAGGTPVAGTAAVGAGESSWSFVPERPWAPGDYLVRAATILEDLAGNSLGRPFEVETFGRVEERALNVTRDVAFQVE